MPHRIQPLDFILLSTVCVLGPQHTTVLRDICGSRSIAPVNDALRRLENDGLVRWLLHPYAWKPTETGRKLFDNRNTALEIIE